MNQFLPSRFEERVERLALGIEPMDAISARPLTYQLQIQHDASLLGLPRPPIERHTSNRYALRYQPGLMTTFDLRFFDQPDRFYKPEHDRRRIVPRRLRVPILSLTDVETQEQAEADAANTNVKDFRRRIRRPTFFPGAAYDFNGTTSLRGRVTRGGGGNPMRWARVVATLEGTSVIVGRAHGDDRGEFLLLINAAVTTGSATPKPLNIDVTVLGPAAAPTPSSPDLPKLDPLWDLPLEILAAPGVDDPVATGVQPPDQPPAQNYTATVTRTVEFTLGKCLSGIEDFVIT